MKELDEKKGKGNGKLSHQDNLYSKKNSQHSLRSASRQSLLSSSMVRDIDDDERMERNIKP
jgi:hypothetical protein